MTRDEAILAANKAKERAEWACEDLAGAKKSLDSALMTYVSAVEAGVIAEIAYRDALRRVEQEFGE